MNKAGRGWSQASQMKPAAEYDIRYGSELLKKESAGWPPLLNGVHTDCVQNSTTLSIQTARRGSPCNVVGFQTSKGDKRESA